MIASGGAAFPSLARLLHRAGGGRGRGPGQGSLCPGPSGATVSALQLRGALLQRVADVRQESLATFDAQRNKVRELAAASPLLSPMIAPGLGRRLASAMSSPQHSYVEPSKGWSPSTLSTGWSPSTLSTMSHTPGKTPPVVTPTLGIYEMEMMNELEDFVLEELSEDESEFDGDVPPFSSVFAAQGSCGKPP